MRSVTLPKAARLLLAASIVFFAAGSLRADPIQTYVALGDALAFGQSTPTPQASFGDQGYVQQFANFLATKNNGIVPNVINLALPGETSSTFFTPDGSASRNAGAAANLNYGGDGALSQTSFLAGVAAAERAAGRTITTVTFALGLGDYLSSTGSSGFSQMTLAQQQASIQQTLTTLQSNYVSALNQIRGVLPNANLYLLNYYNPYASLGPNNVNNQLFTTFVNGQNQIIHSLAPQYNASLVDLLSSVSSNPANFNSSGPGFPFPTAAGFTAIGNSVVSVAEAPEPGSLPLLAVGAVGFAGTSWLRRRGG
jgi:lysophospholipase L1-like esterase